MVIAYLILASKVPGKLRGPTLVKVKSLSNHLSMWTLSTINNVMSFNCSMVLSLFIIFCLVKTTYLKGGWWMGEKVGLVALDSKTHK